ncbi:hypothetical protein UPYG_G00072550 [Umbra pygmaea]|uniref:Uncharacterized protein n=1 Tax=Umbra pygmaea TaxID=75934 RepID=A0ABD0XBW9_UMBPY
MNQTAGVTQTYRRCSRAEKHSRKQKLRRQRGRAQTVHQDCVQNPMPGRMCESLDHYTNSVTT